MRLSINSIVEAISKVYSDCISRLNVVFHFHSLFPSCVHSFCQPPPLSVSKSSVNVRNMCDFAEDNFIDCPIPQKYGQDNSEEKKNFIAQVAERFSNPSKNGYGMEELCHTDSIESKPTNDANSSPEEIIKDDIKNSGESTITKDQNENSVHSDDIDIEQDEGTFSGTSYETPSFVGLNFDLHEMTPTDDARIDNNVFYLSDNSEESSSTFGSPRQGDEFVISPSNVSIQFDPIITSPITVELEDLAASNSTSHTILFHTNSAASVKHSSWKWGDSSFVRVPCSPENTKWATIQGTLSKLKQDCENGRLQQKPTDIGGLLKQSMLLYNDNSCNSDFKLLSHNATLCKHILSTLPKIVDLALLLPKLLANPIPILSKDSNKTIHVSKLLCSSLLANAFLCTLPDPWKSMPDINFIRLFDLSNKPEKANVKGEKLMCILNYFHQMHGIFESAEGAPDLDKLENYIVSFERRCLDKPPKWNKFSKQLIPVLIDSTGKIEDKHEMLQADFANKIVGGGVIGNGAVMEEIRFSICPELIVSRIFTAPLEDNEVLFIKGSQQFSSHSGYAASFKYTGPINQSNLPKDNLNRMMPEVVCMDALFFKQNEISKQFKAESINRELYKCAVAFRSPTSPSSPVATGNWGCGAFNGDAELKFLIQWIAASEAERESLCYFTIGDEQQEKSILELVDFLEKAQIDVKTLYNIVLQFYDEHFHCDSIFDFVMHYVNTNSRPD